MKTRDGFIQGYNAQAAVDATAQVIVAHGLDAKRRPTSVSRSPAVKPIWARSPRSCRRTPAIAPTPTLRRWRPRNRGLFRAGAGQARGEGEGGGARVAAMREKIRAGGHEAYRLRKRLPEPVFSQIKRARGFRQFLLRGVEKVARNGPGLPRHNILKLAHEAHLVPGRGDGAKPQMRIGKTQRDDPCPCAKPNLRHADKADRLLEGLIHSWHFTPSVQTRSRTGHEIVAMSKVAFL